MSSAWTASLAAVLTAVLTFILLCSGGLVTSHGAGMAVPDWPNTLDTTCHLFVEKRLVDYEPHSTLRGGRNKLRAGDQIFTAGYDYDKLKLATLTGTRIWFMSTAILSHGEHADHVKAPPGNLQIWHDYVHGLGGDVVFRAKNHSS